MAFRTPINCSTDDIEALEKVLRDELAQGMDEVVNDIRSLEGSTSIGESVSTGNELLQGLLNNTPSGPFRYLEDMVDATGIDGALEDEKRIFDTTEAVLTSGVVFSKSAQTAPDDNIEQIRRIYFALDRDLEELFKFVTSPGDSNFRFKLDVITLPPFDGRRSLTLAEVRSRLNDNSLVESDYAVLSDKSIIYVKKTPLITPGLSQQYLEEKMGILPEQSTSTIIHITDVNTTSSSINRWVRLGYEDELPYILESEDPATDAAELSNDFNNTKSQVNKLINELLFYRARLDGARQDNLKGRISNQLVEIYKSIIGLVSSQLFQVSTLNQLETLINLRKRLSDSEIKHLLESQRYVKGINFNLNDEQLSDLILSVNEVLTGEPNLSSQYLNQSPDIQEENYNTLLTALYNIQNASTYWDNNIIEIRTIDYVIERLRSIDSLSIKVTQSPADPVAGYPSYTSNGSLMLEKIDFLKNFQLSLGLGDLDKALADLSRIYEAAISRGLTKLLKAAANVLTQAIQSISQVKNLLQSQLFSVKRQLDEFMSKYMTLIGSGDFNSSVLKCAVDFNLGISTGIFDTLFSLLEGLASQIEALVGSLAAILQKAIDKILCPALIFVDRIIGTANSYLPPFCSFNAPILLPDDAIAAIRSIRSIALLQNNMFSFYVGDVIRFRAIVTTARDRLTRFTSEAACMSNPATSMLNTAIVNINAGFGL